MLEALVIAGLVAAPLGSAALFLPARHHRRAAGAWATTWRVILAVAGSRCSPPRLSGCCTC